MKKETVIQLSIVSLLIVILGGIIFYYVKNNSSGGIRNNMNNIQNESTVEVTSKKNEDGTYDLELDNSKWNYDEKNDIYYQIGIVYCSKPETTDYETLSIYVPGKFFEGTKNKNGTYTCKINNNNKIGNYTVATAPIVMPINTAGYSAQHAQSSYASTGLEAYLSEGMIYVYAGCRGRYEEDTEITSGAPWGVTDLKAVIRFLKYNKDSIPANTERIFTFGHSGGGAQSAIVGATGDSSLYNDYLESIGACMKDKEGNEISDSICGAMCWCPITNLDIADEAYEWNMGQFMTSGTRKEGTFTKELSKDLAKAYGEYINNLGLKDEDGNELKLDQIKSLDAGIFTAGSYYEYVLEIVQESLNNFLKDTKFPYTPSNSFMADGGFGGKNNGENNSGSSSSTTYNSAKEYIASLNTDETWITYDEKTNTAKISSLEAFVKYQKSATKDVGAFDNLSKAQAENKLFGNVNSNSLHFDSVMAKLLDEKFAKYSEFSNWDYSYVSSYKEDIENKDSLGKTVLERVNMYNPMYYLSSYYEGNNTSNVAKHWRINTGITQSDTASVTEINLALALKNNKNVNSVDFTTVWGQGHTTAERTGDSETNFVAWINNCLNSKD